MTSFPPLPEGFVLEGQDQGLPPLPEGFVLEGMDAGPQSDASEGAAYQGGITGAIIRGATGLAPGHVLPESAKAFAHDLGGVIGSGLKSSATMPAAADRTRQEEIGRLLDSAGEDPETAAGDMVRLSEMFGGEDRAGLLRMAERLRAGEPVERVREESRSLPVMGEIADPEQTQRYQAGERVVREAQERFPRGEGYEDKFFLDVVGSTASLLSFAAISSVTGPIGSFGFAGMLGAQEAYDRARAQGMEPEAALDYAFQGVLPGALQAAPAELILRKLPAGKRSNAMVLLRRVGEAFGGEFLVENSGAILQNLVEAQYNPDKQWHEGVPMQGVTSGTGAAGIQALFIALARRGPKVSVDTTRDAWREASDQAAREMEARREQGEELIDRIEREERRTLTPEERADRLRRNRLMTELAEVDGVDDPVAEARAQEIRGMLATMGQPAGEAQDTIPPPPPGFVVEGAGAQVSAEFSGLFDENGQPRRSTHKAVRDFKQSHGVSHDVVRAIQNAVLTGESITLEQAMEFGQREAAERQTERDRYFSDEATAERDAAELARLESERSERDALIESAGPISDGIYEDTGTGLRYEVVGRLVMVQGEGGEMVPYGNIGRGEADANGVSFASWIKDGSVQRTATQDGAEQSQAVDVPRETTPEAPRQAPVRPGEVQGEQAQGAPAAAQDAAPLLTPPPGEVTQQARPAAEAEIDLLGPVPTQQQALADRQRAVDETLSPTQEAPAPESAGDLLDPGRERQTDLTDQTQPDVDLSAVPDSVFSAFPDMLEANSGLIPLNNFTQAERDALRAAGLVETGTLDSGETHEGVDAQRLWPERQRRTSAGRPGRAQPHDSRGDQGRRGLRQIREDFEANQDNPDVLSALLNELWVRIEGKDGVPRAVQSLYDQISAAYADAPRAQTVKGPSEASPAPQQTPADAGVSASEVDAAAAQVASRDEAALTERFPDAGRRDARSSGDFGQADPLSEPRHGQGDIPLVGTMPKVSSAQASLLESLSDGSPTADTKRLRDSREGKSLISELRRLADGPLAGPGLVESNMLRLGQNLKIVNGVVQSVPVDVMNDFFGAEGTAQMVLHNNAVLETLPPNAVNHDAYEAVRSIVSRESPDVPARARTAQEFSPVEMEEPSITRRVTESIPQSDRLEQWLGKVRGRFEVGAKPDALAQADALLERVRAGDVGEGTETIGRGGNRAEVSPALAQLYRLARLRVTRNKPSTEDLMADIVRIQREAEGRLESRASQGRFERFSALGDSFVSLEQTLEDVSNVMGVTPPFDVIITNEMPLGTLMLFNPSTRQVEVRADYRAERWQAAQHMVEEVMHGIDALRPNRTLSASSALFARDGAIRMEAQAVFDSGGELSGFLAYPMDAARHSDLTDSRIKAELFARLGVLYLGQPRLMQETMPNAYRAYHEIFRLSQPDPTDGSAWVFGRIWRTRTGRSAQVLRQHGPVLGTRQGASTADSQGRDGEGLGEIRRAVSVAIQGNRLGARAQLGKLETKEPRPSAGVLHAGSLQDVLRDPMFSFAGPRAATADGHALITARSRIEAGEDAEAVRKETGWFRGADGRWRFEIDDSQARLRDLRIGKLGEVIDHPRLFAAYPALADIDVSIRQHGKASGEPVGGSYDGNANRITVNVVDGREGEALSILLHEIQHGIQRIEGFARGGSPQMFRRPAAMRADPEVLAQAEALIKWRDELGKTIVELTSSKPPRHLGSEWHTAAMNLARNPERLSQFRAELERAQDPYDAYERLAGEVEARNVQARLTFTEADRRTLAPDWTTDVDAADVIVVFNGQEMADAPTPVNAAQLAMGMTREAVQTVAANLMRPWRRRPGVRVAQSESGLPLAVRNMIEQEGAQGQVNAVYVDGEIWIVADRMANAQAVERAVLHEVMGHHGLRQMLGRDLEPVLNQIYIRFGRSDEARRIREVYYPGNTFDPSKKEHRHTLAEELIAHLAETGAQPTLLQRVIAAINNGLRRLGFSIQLTRSDLLDLIRRSRQTVEHGGIDLAPEGTVAMSRAAFQRSETTRQAYEARIDQLFDGAEPSNTSGVRVLDRSDILGLLGYEAHEVVLAEKHAVSDGRFNHPEFTAQDWKKVPAWMDDPVAVFERTDGNLTIIAPETKNGQPIIVGVSPDVASPPGIAGGRRFHVLLTAYNKDRGRMPIDRMVDEGWLRYVDYRKAPDFNRRSGHRLPSNSGDFRGYGRKIHTGADLFKYRQSDARFSRGDLRGFEPGPAIESHVENMVRARAFFDSVSDVLRRQPRLRGLADAIDNYYDGVDKYRGEVDGHVRSVMRDIRKLPGAKQREVFDNFKRYQAAKENGRKKTAETLRETGGEHLRKLIEAWEWIADHTGEINQKVGVEVYDPMLVDWSEVRNQVGGQIADQIRNANPREQARMFADAVRMKARQRGLNVGDVSAPLPRKGGWRRIGRVKGFWPRAFRPEIHEALYNPSSHPDLWSQMVDALIAEGHIEKADEAGRYLRQHGESRANDYFAGIEKARMQPLPEMFYDYSWDSAMVYKEKWARRVSQIEQFGQKKGDKQGDRFGEVLKEVYDERTRNYLIEVMRDVYMERPVDATAQFIGNLNIMATGIQLGNPYTATRNWLTGMIYNWANYGFRPSILAMGSMLKDISLAWQDAYQAGVLKEDLISLLHDAEQQGVSQRLSKGTSFLMKWGGYNITEQWIRVHAMLTGRHFLLDALRHWNRNIGSAKSKRYLAFMQRHNIDTEALIRENGVGPETDKWLRLAVNIPQGSYKLNMVPLFVDTPIGRFLWKYQKYGTQRSREFWQNGLRPFVQGDTVVYTDKDGVKKSERVRSFETLLRYFVAATVGGTATAKVLEVLFGTIDPGPGLDELEEALKDDDRKNLLSLLFARAWHSAQTLGALGFFQAPVQATMDIADRQRMKSPLSPPGLAPLESVGELILRYVDQGGVLTARDIDNTLNRTVSMYRATKRISLGAVNLVTDEVREAQLEALRRDRLYVRKMTRRYAEEHDLKGKRRASGSFGATEMTPVHRRIHEELLLGNAQTARQLAMQAMRDAETNRDVISIAASIKASVRAFDPARVSAAPSEYERAQFLEWVGGRVSDANYQRVRRVTDTYQDAAVRAGLMTRRHELEVEIETLRRNLNESLPRDMLINRTLGFGGL